MLHIGCLRRERLIKRDRERPPWRNCSSFWPRSPFATLVRKMKGVRRIEVDYEEVLKDKENLRPVYKFLGLEPPPAGADKTVKMHPTDIPWYDYIGRKDPATGEITCPWRRGRGKVPSGGSSGVQMAG